MGYNDWATAVAILAQGASAAQNEARRTRPLSAGHQQPHGDDDDEKQALEQWELLLQSDDTAKRISDSGDIEVEIAARSE